MITITPDQKVNNIRQAPQLAVRRKTNYRERERERERDYDSHFVISILTAGGNTLSWHCYYCLFHYDNSIILIFIISCLFVPPLHSMPATFFVSTNETNISFSDCRKYKQRITQKCSWLTSSASQASMKLRFKCWGLSTADHIMIRPETLFHPNLANKNPYLAWSDQFLTWPG